MSKVEGRNYTSNISEPLQTKYKRFPNKTHKNCPKCKQLLPLSAFGMNTCTRQRIRSYCRKCEGKVQVEWKNANPQVKERDSINAVNSNRLRKFGITILEYEKKKDEQNNVCMICKKPETTIIKGKLKGLAVDHNHKTGKIRGLLCSNCNAGIGWFKEDILVLTEAIKYLERYNYD